MSKEEYLDVFPDNGGKRGIVLRDLLAIVAMRELTKHVGLSANPHQIALESYGYADAMLQRRSKKSDEKQADPNAL